MQLGWSLKLYSVFDSEKSSWQVCKYWRVYCQKAFAIMSFIIRKTIYYYAFEASSRPHLAALSDDFLQRILHC